MGSLSGGLASMGAGVPYAIAAKFAYPDRPVIALVGDGAMQMNDMAELITVKKYHEQVAQPDLRRLRAQQPGSQPGDLGTAGDGRQSQVGDDPAPARRPLSQIRRDDRPRRASSSTIPSSSARRGSEALSRGRPTRARGQDRSRGAAAAAAYHVRPGQGVHDRRDARAIPNEEGMIKGSVKQVLSSVFGRRLMPAAATRQRGPAASLAGRRWSPGRCWPIPRWSTTADRSTTAPWCCRSPRRRWRSLADGRLRVRAELPALRRSLPSIHAASIAVGAAGLGFHAYNVTRKAGGLSWNNLFYQAPIGAPAALVTVRRAGRCRTGAGERRKLSRPAAACSRAARWPASPRWAWPAHRRGGAAAFSRRLSQSLHVAAGDAAAARRRSRWRAPR